VLCIIFTCTLILRALCLGLLGTQLTGTVRQCSYYVHEYNTSNQCCISYLPVHSFFVLSVLAPGSVFLLSFFVHVDSVATVCFLLLLLAIDGSCTVDDKCVYVMISISLLSLFKSNFVLLVESVNSWCASSVKQSTLCYFLLVVHLLNHWDLYVM